MNLPTSFLADLCLPITSDIFFLRATNSSRITFWCGAKAGLAMTLPELVDGDEATKSAAAPGLDNNLEGPKLTIGDDVPDPGDPDDEACW